MQRFSFGLVLTSASLLVFGGAVLMPSPAAAFETQSGTVTVPGAFGIGRKGEAVGQNY